MRLRNLHEGYCPHCGGSDYETHGERALFSAEPWSRLAGRIPAVGKVVSGHRRGCPIGKVGEKIGDGAVTRTDPDFYTIKITARDNTISEVYDIIKENGGMVVKFANVSLGYHNVVAVFDDGNDAMSAYGEFQHLGYSVGNIDAALPEQSLLDDVNQFADGSVDRDFVMHFGLS